ncbi:MAG: energy-coupled thiamine transporter ThiT [Clostridia bacterium]|nr:energy-coupled thiamine transporter ThiT [Clostridia bacterium]
MKKILAAMFACAVFTCAAGFALAEENAPGAAGFNFNILAVVCLLVGMGVCIFISAKRARWNASMIAKAAMCIALAYLLSMIKVFRMPMGGTVTLVSMLPLILFAVAYGPLDGIVVGSAYGLLSLLIDPYVIHPLQLLADYPMAYAAVVLACVVNVLPVKKVFKLPIAVVLGYLGRYILAVLSGCVFFAEYAGEQNAIIYSLVYNISYLGPEMIACAALMFIPAAHRLPEIIRGTKRR